MSVFFRELRNRQPDPSGRRWLYVPYDQLSDGIGPLSREPAEEIGLVLLESAWKARRRPYHRQKLALVLANQRHFALEQAGRGVAIRYVAGDAPYPAMLEDVLRETGPLRVMRPAERELRRALAPLARSGGVQEVPHEGWLTGRADFLAGAGAQPPWRMDAFYRHYRRTARVLMEGRRPAGGRFSFDAENRRSWKGEPAAPKPPRFGGDPVKEEVVALVAHRFRQHPGRLDPGSLPSTRADAERLWRWALRRCLPHFGPYEDAMSERSRGLFHTRVSAVLNLHRILPARLLRDVLAADLPLPSREGFLRQLLWREFVHHVHEETDGLRRLPGGRPPVRREPGDGGFARWSRKCWTCVSPTGPDGGAAPSALGAAEPVPPAYWGAATGMRCLDEVVRSVWEEGWSHHITRLMVLANLATLLDVSPRALTDWFWCAYTDAYDWVVEPNVLGMGTFAAGDLMTTKPYVAGSGYIDRMSDHCGACRFDPRGDCPWTPLYWEFLARHEGRLRRVPRMLPALQGLSRRPPMRRRADRAIRERVQQALRRGEPLAAGGTPAHDGPGRRTAAKGKRRSGTRRSGE